MTVQEQLDVINAEIARGGVVRVKLPDGSEVQRSNLTELMNTRSQLLAELSAANGTGYLSEIAFRSRD